MIKIITGVLAAAAIFGITSCSQMNLSEEITSDIDAKYVINWETWNPLDYFDSRNWNKADWTNGGMFNCGWKPDHVTFNNGQMTLKLDNTYSHGKSYTSGEYRSNNKFHYGTFETNMIAAKGDGLVTSFFTYTDNPWDEIDVEILGKDTTKVQFNYYVNGQGGHEALIDLGFDASQGYHKYTIEWGNGWINWYVDGKWKYGVNNTGFNAPYGAQMPSHDMQIMCNLWNGIGVDEWLKHYWHNGTKYAYYDYILYKPMN